MLSVTNLTLKCNKPLNIMKKHLDGIDFGLLTILSFIQSIHH